MSGALGSLVAGVDPEQVLSAVRAVSRGHAVFGPHLGGRLLPLFAARAPPLPDLSVRESDVLTSVAERLSHAGIGRAPFFAELQVSSRAQAVARVRPARGVLT